MAATRRKTPKAANVCVDADVSLPLVRPKAKQPTSAADLSDGQIYLLAELAARQGGHPADRCYTMFGFRPTAEDRREIGRRAWPLRGEIKKRLALSPRRI